MIHPLLFEAMLPAGCTEMPGAGPNGVEGSGPRLCQGDHNRPFDWGLSGGGRLLGWTA